MKFGIRRFLNKFLLKWCKRFPPHMNNVSTLRRETWNAHCTRTTVELLQKETPEFIHLNCSGVSFCNNWTVVRVRRAFQVSQVSAGTLFRWGGKRLHYFAANLFRKQCTKFYRNRPSFIEDITKNILVSFFLDTLYILQLYTFMPTVAGRWELDVKLTVFSPATSCRRRSVFRLSTCLWSCTKSQRTRYLTNRSWEFHHIYKAHVCERRWID